MSRPKRSKANWQEQKRLIGDRNSIVVVLDQNPSKSKSRVRVLRGDHCIQTINDLDELFDLAEMLGDLCDHIEDEQSVSSLVLH